MKLIILLTVLALSRAAKLDRTYLPPTGAGSAGGSPGALQAPAGPGAFSQGSPAFSNTRESFGAVPAPKYGPPSAGNFGNGFTGAAAPSQAFSGANAPSHGLKGVNAPSRVFNPNQANSENYNAAQGFNAGFNTANQLTAPTGNFNAPQGFNAANVPSQGFNTANVPSQGFNGEFATPNQATVPTGIFNAPQGFNAGATAYTQPERAQAAQERSAQILRNDFQNDGENFAYSFETSNGISAEENGVATNGVQAQGAFSYTGDDGQVYSVTYTADENGYQPRGDHLPTPPPIPDEILRSIELNRAAEAAGTIGEGAYNEQYNSETPAEQYNAPSGPTAPQQQYGAIQQFGSVNGQRQKPTQYNAPRPDGFSEQTRSQFNAPSQQYGTPAQGHPQKYSVPSQQHQQYDAPSQQYNGPSQQFNAPGVSGSRGTVPSQKYETGPAQQYRSQNGPQQYNAPSQQFNAPGVSGSRGTSPSQKYETRPIQQYSSQNGPQQYNGQSSRAPSPSQQYGSPQQNEPQQFKPQVGSQQYNGQAASNTRGPTPSQQYGAPSAQSVMTREQYNSAPYSYNPPRGVPSQPGATPQINPNAPSQSGGPSQFNPLAAQTFNGNSAGARPNAPNGFPAARQPPSFNQQDGYKY